MDIANRPLGKNSSHPLDFRKVEVVLSLASIAAAQNVRFWHKADIPHRVGNVRYWG